MNNIFSGSILHIFTFCRIIKFQQEKMSSFYHSKIPKNSAMTFAFLSQVFVQHLMIITALKKIHYDSIIDISNGMFTVLVVLMEFNKYLF